MKRWLALFVLLLFLPGCSDSDAELNRVLAVRSKLTQGNGCLFDAVITADYGDEVYTFNMECQSNKNGELKFSVTDPTTISGICGTVSGDGGNLMFDDTTLAFDVLADGQITPVSAPWHMIKALRGGYISACGQDGDYLRISVDDSYREDALHMDIWLDTNDLPLRGEILWQGRRVLSVEVRNFRFV